MPGGGGATGFPRGLVCKAHTLCVSLKSRLESSQEEEFLTGWGRAGSCLAISIGGACQGLIAAGNLGIQKMKSEDEVSLQYVPASNKVYEP